MKYGVCVVATALCLVACNKGPTVNVKNATGNEVATAVKQSGVMTSDSMVEPGLWQSKVTVLGNEHPRHAGPICRQDEDRALPNVAMTRASTA